MSLPGEGGVLAPYHEACEREADEIDGIFEEAMDSFAHGRHFATGPVKSVSVLEDGKDISVPVRLDFRHEMYNVGKAQTLSVLAVTPKQADVELGKVTRILYLGHTIGVPEQRIFGVHVGKGDEAKHIEALEDIFVDEDSKKLLDILKQYSESGLEPQQ